MTTALQMIQLQTAESPLDRDRFRFSRERLESRRVTLGASEIAAVAGLHPFVNALDVFLSKTAPIVEQEANAGVGPRDWGHRLEDDIAQMYADVHGVMLARADTCFHPTEPWMSASPDRLVLVGASDIIDRGLECKSRNARVAHLFGESGTDIVPDDIAAQCHWTMIVFVDIPVWDAAVLIGGNDWRWFRIEQDREIAADLQQIGWDFMHNNVLKGIAPPVDGSESWTRHIKTKFAKHSEQLRDATAEEAELIGALRSVRAEAKQAEAQLAVIENQLKAAIGESAGILAPNGKVTWKSTKDTTGPDYQAMTVELALRLKLSMDEQKQLLEKHTTVTKQGSRRFLPTFIEG